MRKQAPARARALGPRSADPSTLQDRIYAQLREALICGQFAPGEALPIQRVTAAFGTSPMPAREAVRRLVAEGALEGQPNRTTRIPRLSAERFEHLSQARVLVEGWASAQAAIHCHANDVSQLREINDQLRGALLRGDGQEIAGLNRKFHFNVYALSGNPLVVNLIENLWMRSGPYVQALMGTACYVDLARNRDFLAHNRRLMLALTRGNSRQAGDAMRRSIRASLDWHLSLLREARKPRPGKHG